MLTPDQIISRLERRLQIVRRLPGAEPFDILLLEERLADAKAWKLIREHSKADPANQPLSPQEPLPESRLSAESLTSSEVKEHIERARRRAWRRLLAMK